MNYLGSMTTFAINNNNQDLGQSWGSKIYSVFCLDFHTSCYKIYVSYAYAKKLNLDSITVSVFVLILSFFNFCTYKILFLFLFYTLTTTGSKTIWLV